MLPRQWALDTLLDWGLRQGLAGAIIGGTVLAIWSSFSLLFGDWGKLEVLGTPCSPRVENMRKEAPCCASPKDNTLMAWDFKYSATCSVTGKGSCASS